MLTQRTVAWGGAWALRRSDGARWVLQEGRELRSAAQMERRLPWSEMEAMLSVVGTR